jgi:ankyrin repeat protein
MYKNILLTIGIVGTIAALLRAIQRRVGIRQGYLEVVEVLLAAGADVHAKDGEGRDALMWASTGDYRRIVRMLLSNRASPKAIDRQGNSALILARSADIAHLLLEAGAEVNTQCHSGKTALMYASYGEIDLVRVLLAAGADPDIRNEDGETALTMTGNDEIRALLKRVATDAPTERGVRCFFRR